MPTCNQCRFYARSGLGAKHCSQSGKLMNPKMLIACDLFKPRAKMDKTDAMIKTLNGSVIHESGVKNAVKMHQPELEPTSKEDGHQ